MKSLRSLFACAACVLIAACGSAAPDGAANTPAADAGPVADTDEAVGSYARGLITGRQSQSAVMDEKAFMVGLRAGLAGEDPQFEDDRMRAGLDALATLERAAIEAETAANIEAGRQFLAENGARAEVTTTASGLQFEVLEEGDGAKPTATSRVRVHYRGTTLDGETFDTSYDDGEPAEFGLSQVIGGWTEGLQLMSVGSKYMLYVPQELAYGTQPRPGSPFGPGATLIFEVELLDILS